MRGGFFFSVLAFFNCCCNISGVGSISSSSCSDIQLQSKIFPSKGIDPGRGGKSIFKYTVSISNIGTTTINGYIISINIPFVTSFIDATVYPRNKVIKASIPPESGNSVLLWEVPRLSTGKTYKILATFSLGSCLSSSATNVGFVSSGYQLLNDGTVQCQKTTPLQKVKIRHAMQCCPHRPSSI